MEKIFSLFLVFVLCTTWASARTDVTSQYLTNADLKSLTGWSYGDDGYNYTDWKTDGNVAVMEFYHTWSANPGTAIGNTRNFHLSQTVTLPAGNYRLVANSFYREGKGDGTSKAYLFAGETQQNIMGLNEGEINAFSGSNALYKSATAFSQGYFPSYVDFTLTAEQEITLGLRGYIDTYDSWCITGPWKLYKYDENEEMTAEAIPEVPTNYVAPSWSEYSMTFSHQWTDDNTSFTSPSISTGETSMTATVTVDQDATLVFEYGNSGSWVTDKGELDVYLDDNLMESINSVEYNVECRHFVEMEAGNHIIKWTYRRNNATSSSVNISNIGVVASPTISVSLLEAGSLGTEVLNQVDHVKNVRKLVITGKMNDDDWEKIHMMPDLLSIDLSGTSIKSIASNFFNSNNFQFLHYVRLPETLENIGRECFYQSYVDDINFPTALKSIGQRAFQFSKIREAMMPNTMESIDSEVFKECYFLKRANFPQSIKAIPQGTFWSCSQLSDLTLHEGLTEIADQGIKSIPFNKRLPSTITTLGDEACAGNWVLDSLFIPEGCTTIGHAAFKNCEKLKYVELPVKYSQVENTQVIYCWGLETIVIKSPTMLTGEYYNSIVPEGRRGSITLKVPSYLVSSYKLDPYWYEFGSIEGFNTSEVKEWYIHQPLVMNNSRFEGEPDVFVQWSSASWKLNGDAAMDINNFYVDWCSPVISNCDNIRILGTYTSCYQTTAKKWYFISLPFNFRVGDIVTKSGSKYAIRYYDGANRAINGTGGNWKNYSADDIITAGTGFIYQTSANDYTFFCALNDASKQKVLSNQEIVLPLATNISATPANKGWNLVGNPWHCYYNIHKLNFMAPITTWNGSTYVAYSIIDDDYAIKPNEAFFVQCPDEVTEITFPTDGRQITSVIESQNGARADQPNSRKLIDIQIACDDAKDKTRIVLNEKASASYETGCDASKFFSMDGGVPQIYTVDEDDNEYAINERPLQNGTVKLRLSIQKSGIYTVSAIRNELKHLVLKDLLTGTTTDLTNDSYTLTLETGIYAERFELSFADNAVTEIRNMTAQPANVQMFNLSGQHVEKPVKGIFIQKGKKIIVK